jgi:hypothetical protein
MILVPNREAVDQARKVEEAAAKELETAEAARATETDRGARLLKEMTCRR